jgi:alpha-glucosidase (family GH31 glycosyl hydrolase)
MYGF